MNWDAIGAIAELLGAIGVIATLLYLSAQIRQNNALTRASVTSSIVSSRSENSRIIAADDRAAEIWWSGLEDREALTEAERRRFDPLAAMVIDSVWMQIELLQESDLVQVDWVLMKPGFASFWEEYRLTVASTVRDYVDSRYAELRSEDLGPAATEPRA